MLNFTIVVVLYQMDLDKSATLQSIKRQQAFEGNFTVIMWDNSPSPSEEAIEYQSRSDYKWKYNHTPQNLSLSRIYNQIILNESFDYIIILDQDTFLPKNYLSLMNEEVMAHPDISLFLPMVKNKQRLVSPGEFKIFRGSHSKSIEPGIISSKNRLAVASGMAIAKRVFKEFKITFDERLNFYGIDSKFMLDYARNEKLLVVLPVVLDHNSALWSNPSAEELLPRFRNLRKAWFILLSDKPVTRIMNTIYYAFKSVMFSIKFRDHRFLH